MLAEQHDPAFWRSLSANPEQHRECASTRKASKHSSTQDSFGSIFRASLPITTERTARREKASRYRIRFIGVPSIGGPGRSEEGTDPAAWTRTACSRRLSRAAEFN